MNLGVPAAVEFEPRGFRDVYWCARLNEPVIVSYPILNGKKMVEPWCTGCADRMLNGDHLFICTILKPWSKQVTDKEKR